MSRTGNPAFASLPRRPRIRWQFDPDVPTSDFFDGIDLATEWGLQEAVENFLYEMEHHQFHAWEGVICEEQGLPATPEQAQARDALVSFGPADNEDPSLEPRVLYINEIARPAEPWYETLRKITARLLLDPFDVAASRSDVHCHSWNEIEECLAKHAAGLSLPQGAASPPEVIPAKLRHRLRLQYCFCGLPSSGFGHLSPDDPDNLMDRFVEDLQASRQAVEYFGLTLRSLLAMVKLPDDERPHFVRWMQQRLGLESIDEPLTPCLFGDSPQAVVGAADGTRTLVPSVDDAPEGPDAPRLSVEAVKRAILHPVACVREHAVHYFADSFTLDTSIMPLVIEALDEYGKDDAYMLVGASVPLPQTADTIDWVIRELNDDRSASYESYTYNLERILCAADPHLLAPRADDIAATAHRTPGAYDVIAERIAMLSWDADRCWRELEEHCDAYREVKYGSEARLDRARRIVEALARHDVSESRVLELLRQEVDPHADTQMKWMEPMIVRLAGELRLETAIPLLVGKMRLDDDVLSHECERGLTRIGGDAVIRAVVDAFAGGDRHFQLVATGVLENIHTDPAVNSILHLIRQDWDDDVGRRLRSILFSQFSPAVVEPARQWLLKCGFADWEDRGMRNELLEMCEVLGRTFPEYEQWMRDHEAEERERLRVLEESKDDPMRGVLWAFEQLTGKKTADVIKEIEEKGAAQAIEAAVRHTARDARRNVATPPSLENRSNRQVRQAAGDARRNVGRNDPCPCGSGKKYKKCCLRK